jgi:uncharacterized membrane protein (UPF0127 family)
VKLQRAFNKTRDRELCPRCELANNIWTRVRGLMWRDSLGADEGLLIVPCPSIHMFNVKFAIDAIFLTKENIVTDIVENIGPGKTYFAKDNAGKPYSTLELAAGTVAQTGTQIGDLIEFTP